MSEFIEITTPQCTFCEEESTIKVPVKGWQAWSSGALIQQAFPEMGADERELVLTGTHAECWEKIFGEADD